MWRMSRLLVVLTVISACSTHKVYNPSLDAPRRDGLEVAEPLLVAVVDGRTGTGDSSASLSDSLVVDLQDIYGAAVQPMPAFGEVPDGRVGIRIRLRRLSANFGSRVIGATEVSESSAKASVSGYSRWQSLHAEVSERSSRLSAGMVGEGWWVGGVWVDVTLVDRRSGKEEVPFSLVEEVRKSNTGGYSSAEAATMEAWRQVTADLLYVVDEVLRDL